jgi:hypothetical protein
MRLERKIQAAAFHKKQPRPMLSITSNEMTTNSCIDLYENVTQMNSSVLLINIAKTKHATASLQYHHSRSHEHPASQGPEMFVRGEGKTEYAVVWLRPVPEVGRQPLNYNSAAKARSPWSKRSDRGSALISFLNGDQPADVEIDSTVDPGLLPHTFVLWCTAWNLVSH